MYCWKNTEFSTRINDLASQINNNRAVAAPQQEPVVKFWQDRCSDNGAVPT
ncbi:hypothetical protein Scep_023266 [Stephania cephalantha]|uniref:Uncharacterized protein n=1 Tax=Stephania cephalantha TaxID=152367 RepID=A0AAP0EV92_9MAGN